MRKMLFILMTIIIATNTMAQEPVASAAYLWRDGCKIYQGDQLLTQQEYKNLLKNTCPEAFAQYRKGEVMANWGWGVLGAGALSMVASCIPLYLPNPYPYHDEVNADGNVVFNHDLWAKHHMFDDAKLAAGLSMIFVGTAVVASSVPIICVGYAKRDKSLGVYNRQCLRKEPAITYSLTAGQNGLGLAVRF